MLLIFLVCFLNLNHLILNKQECFYDETYSTRIVRNTFICLYRCIFRECQTSTSGGAIYISIEGQQTGKNYFESCIFHKCQSIEGGAIYISTTEISNTEFYNCSLTSNVAKLRGGSFFIIKANYTIIECQFSENEVKNQEDSSFGGVMSIYDSIGFIRKCKFNNNIASMKSANNYYFTFGGAIQCYQTNGTIEDCEFNHNYIYCIQTGGKTLGLPESSGGAIMLTGSNFYIIGCLFYNNTATGDASYTANHHRGGAIYLNMSSSISVNYCKFINNTLYESGNTIERVHIICGSAFYFYLSTGNFSNCIFENNSAVVKVTQKLSLTFVGTAVYSQNHETKGNFNNCYFCNNTGYVNAREGDNQIIKGGAIFQEEYELNCTKCTFIQNSLLYNLYCDENFGGAIYCVGGEFIDCCFNDNVAQCGGHIYYSQEYELTRFLFVKNCSFVSTHNYNGYMESLFHFDASINSSTPNEFINCTISVSNINNLLLFNGTIKDRYDYSNTHLDKIKTYFKFKFENNCANSYHNFNFTSKKYSLLNEFGNANQTFETAFENICIDDVKCPPFVFNYPPTFSPSFEPIQSTSIFSPSFEPIQSTFIFSLEPIQSTFSSLIESMQSTFTSSIESMQSTFTSSIESMQSTFSSFDSSHITNSDLFESTEILSSNDQNTFYHSNENSKSFAFSDSNFFDSDRNQNQNRNSTKKNKNKFIKTILMSTIIVLEVILIISVIIIIVLLFKKIKRQEECVELLLDN